MQAATLLNRAKDAIKSVIGFRELDRGSRDGHLAERGESRPEIDGVFLGCDKSVNVLLAAESNQLSNVVLAIGMVVTIDFECNRLDASGFELDEKLPGPADGAKNQRTEGRIGNG